jgi:hypothetical protein
MEMPPPRPRTALSLLPSSRAERNHIKKKISASSSLALYALALPPCLSLSNPMPPPRPTLSPFAFCGITISQLPLQSSSRCHSVDCCIGSQSLGSIHPCQFSQRGHCCRPPRLPWPPRIIFGGLCPRQHPPSQILFLLILGSCCLVAVAASTIWTPKNRCRHRHWLSPHLALGGLQI